jgi:ABC-type phosphate transport system substrate-binding protein
MKKRRVWGVTISISTAVALATVGMSARADPQGPPQYRPLVGVGADTTQGVMNAMSDAITGGLNNTKIIASENAFGTASLTVKDPSASPLCTLTRPFESGGGVSALEQSMARGDGCVQFARSSTTNLSNYAPQDLTFIPFAQDAVSYAV